jgi:hypothetical protein
MEKPIVLYTNHITNRVLCHSFAKGSGSLMCHVDNFEDFNKTIATYGYLRGTGEAIRKSKNFYYLDHGYFNQSNRIFENNKTKILNLDGYFRVSFNDYWSNGLSVKPSDRFNKLNLKFKPTNNNGKFIIVSEPTSDAIQYYKLHNWTKQTIAEIKKYTDRTVVLHNRTSKKKLTDLLPEAWAFVSDHSSAGFLAMLEGVPAYFTNKTLKNIGRLENIEKHDINYSLLNNLAYEQWTITEIQSGECWDHLKNNNFL